MDKDKVKAKVERIHEKTLRRLEDYRTHPRESIDDLITAVLNKLDTAQTEIAIANTKIATFESKLNSTNSLI